MLRGRPGVFAAGEMLDWEAPTGGYLLQACFSTGFAAAKARWHGWVNLDCRTGCTKVAIRPNQRFDRQPTTPLFHSGANMSASRPRTLFDKIWDSHVVEKLPDGTCILYIDRHLLHEVTSPQAFEGLRLAGRKLRRPD